MTIPTATPRVIQCNWIDIHTPDGTTTNPAQVCAQTSACPLFGDLFAIGVVGGADFNGNPRRLLSVRDTKNNLWRVTPYNGNGQAGYVQWAYTGASGFPATPGHDLALTLTWDADFRGVGSRLVFPVIVYDIVGGGVTFEGYTMANGFQSGGAGTTSVDTGTTSPKRMNALTMAVIGVNAFTLRRISTSGIITANPWFPEESGTTNGLHEDNGAGHYYGSASKLWTWNLDGAGGVADWAFQAITFSQPNTHDAYKPLRFPAQLLND